MKKILALLLAVITVFSLVGMVSASQSEGEFKIVYKVTVNDKFPTTQFWGIIMGEHSGQYTLMKSDNIGYFKVVNRDGQWVDYSGNVIEDMHQALDFNGFMYEADGKLTAKQDNYYNEKFNFYVIEIDHNMRDTMDGHISINDMTTEPFVNKETRATRCHPGSICGFNNVNMYEFASKQNYDLNTMKLQVKVDLEEVVPPLPFTDVQENAWFYSGVRYVYENGYMTGTSATTFAPNAEMTRAQAAMIMMNLKDGKPGTAEDIPFTDVPENTWYTGAVAWAYKNGVMAGTGETTFAPEEELTREQFVVIMYRSFTEQDKVDAKLDKTFPDSGNISSWALDAMNWAVDTGLISGIKNGDEITLAPKDVITRAQVATVLAK